MELPKQCQVFMSAANPLIEILKRKRNRLKAFIGFLPCATRDRIACDLTDKGNCQHAWQSYAALCVPDVPETDGHAFVTHAWLCPVGA